MPVAFAIRDPANALAAVFLLFGFASMMMTELALRFWSQHSDAPTRPMLSAPPIGHTETAIVIAIACVYPPAFGVLAYLFGVACFAAAGARVAQAVVHLSGAQS